jgi:hypothetical protein
MEKENQIGFVVVEKNQRAVEKKIFYIRFKFHSGKIEVEI